jgi:hypothetical protein
VSSINENINSTLTSLEENLINTTIVNEKFQKTLIFNIIKQRKRNQYITRKRRINAIRSPFSTTIRTVKGVLGVNSKDEVIEKIDTSALEEDFKKTWEIIDNLEYSQLLKYYHETMKHNLKKTNNKWKKEKK